MGRFIYNAFDLSPDSYAPDPLDVDLGDGRGNRRQNPIDFKALEQHLREIRPEGSVDSSALLRLRQLGDQGLRAAMNALKPKPDSK